MFVDNAQNNNSCRFYESFRELSEKLKTRKDIVFWAYKEKSKENVDFIIIIICTINEKDMIEDK
uniref:Uncharacterized protein n=1 Tax=Arion vulgaris TaxID=1028688 RepID=A0A0B7B3D4_9EUPU